MNIQRRLELLEQRLISKPIVLLMPDGRTETLRGPRYYTLDLFKRACEGNRTRDLDLIAQSISSMEPGGGHMLDLVRGVLAHRTGDKPEDDETQDDETQDDETQDDTPVNLAP